MLTGCINMTPWTKMYKVNVPYFSINFPPAIMSNKACLPRYHHCAWMATVIEKRSPWLEKQ